MNNFHLSIDEMRDLDLRMQTLMGYKAGIHQAVTYLKGTHTGYLEILNTQRSDDPLIISRKQEVLADIERLSKLEKEYRQKIQQVLSDLHKEYNYGPSEPSSTEE